MAGFTKRYGPEGPLIDARLTREVVPGSVELEVGVLRSERLV
jgi:hypothetical protein